MVKENPSFWRLYTRLMLQPSISEAVMSIHFEEKSAANMQILNSFFIEQGCLDSETEFLLFAALLKGAIISYIGAPELFPIDKLENKIIDFYKQKFKTNK